MMIISLKLKPGRIPVIFTYRLLFNMFIPLPLNKMPSWYSFLFVVLVPCNVDRFVMPSQVFWRIWKGTLSVNFFEAATAKVVLNRSFGDRCQKSCEQQMVYCACRIILCALLRACFAAGWLSFTNPASFLPKHTFYSTNIPRVSCSVRVEINVNKLFRRFHVDIHAWGTLTAATFWHAFGRSLYLLLMDNVNPTR